MKLMIRVIYKIIHKVILKNGQNYIYKTRLCVHLYILQEILKDGLGSQKTNHKNLLHKNLLNLVI